MGERHYQVGCYEDGGRGRDGSVRACLSGTEMDHHTVLFGDTGTGKTRLLYQIISQQIDAGHSVIYLNPKETSLNMMIGYCEDRRVHPSRVHVLSHAHPGIAPGWNPLRSNLPLAHAVSRFADMSREILKD